MKYLALALFAFFIVRLTLALAEVGTPLPLVGVVVYAAGLVASIVAMNQLDPPA